MKEHPQAKILRAIADGKTIEVHTVSGWGAPFSILQAIADHEVNPRYEFRIKPETITINGHEVPAPMRGPLGDGQEYWLTDPAKDLMCALMQWTGSDFDFVWLTRGLIHLTEDAAIAHAEALLSFTRSDK